MIDPDKVRQFWESRAETYRKVAFESIANLEQTEDNLKRKIDDETRKVFDWLPDLSGLSVLDLGAGVGQWSFRFAERGARRVLAVEYAEGLVEIGRQEATQRNMNQVEFVASSAEQFRTDEQFDLVYISGLCVYLNDEQLETLLSVVHGFVKPGGLLMLRDGTAIGTRYELNDVYSSHLEQNYSATYRPVDDYIQQFTGTGLTLLRNENMFPEGHPLNKYPETRLHLFLFGRTA